MLIKIKFSDKLSTYLEEYKENKIVKILLNLRDTGIEETNLIADNNYVDYLNLKDDCNISYIKVSSIAKNNVEDPWHKSRQNCGLTQILGRIINTRYNTELLNTNQYRQTDIEQLSAMLRAKQMKTCKIEILRGFDILEAYNWSGKIDVTKINSCANFRQQKGSCHAEPKIKWFYPYIYNKNCSAIVVKDEAGKIRARTVCFEGFQKENSGKFKKGVKYKFINTPYQEDAAFGQVIKDYCALNGIHVFAHGDPDSLVISFDCKYKTWPPFDNFYVDISKNLLFTKSNSFNNKYSLRSTYKLVAPDGRHMEKNVKA